MAEKPNVLLISVDHWPGDLLGALGHPTILTPTLDRLFANGIVYSNAYTSTPTCIPSRRELMTGTFSPTHGDRIFDQTMRMPELRTLAQTFRDAGYQAFAVGKLHVFPQRDRIGFDEALINEEGRHREGTEYEMPRDDYEMFLAEEGYAGQEQTHAVGAGRYNARPWHLPERYHTTNWTVREMCKYIVRRDPTKPAFWFMSFQYPHPPLVPPRDYLEMYRDIEIDMPYIGDWAQSFDALPYALRARSDGLGTYPVDAIRQARQAFYAQCTYIDHQIALAIGTLQEEGLVDDTIVAFTSDHGDMLGNHGLYAKGVFYEDSARLPLVLLPHAGSPRQGGHEIDDRLAAQADIFPALLELCGIPVPDSVEGLSLVGDERRDHLYGEHWEDGTATRMIRKGDHKLIYYPVGNHTQLFDLAQDPHEMRDRSRDAAYAEALGDLTALLIGKLYGGDEQWVQDGRLVGLPDIEGPSAPRGNRSLGNQRGWRF